MLRELRIRDFAVAEDVRVEFGPGLSALTGETGAGKSILVEALGLLVGGRPSADMIRVGQGRAIVEGRFEVPEGSDIEALCDDAGVEPEEGWVLLKRELRREGRHRAWVNGSPATTTLLRTLGGLLLDLHGQHEHQRLLDRGAQRRLLDAYGENADAARQLERAWGDHRAVLERLEEVREAARVGRERADYLRFKAEEIEAAGPEVGEDDALARESSRLEHSEELLGLSSRLSAALYEDEGSIVEQLGSLERSLSDLARIDEDARRFVDLFESALRQLEELGRELGAYPESVEHDPRRLAEIRARGDVLYKLKRKYGDTLEEVVRAGEEARRELDAIEGSADEIRRLEADARQRQLALDELAGKLSAAREEAARRLEQAVSRSLPELGMAAGDFRVALERLDATGRHGRERVEFLISLNPGFPPAPLSRIASGGEMSRLMLALETALVSVDEVPILVFDEVDAGVGGEVAHRVAERLVRVSAGHQVLVVTHLAQIAARADAHYSVGKDTSGEVTRTFVRRLSPDERVEEVARMLGGDPESDASRAHAKELLSARQ